VIISLKDEVVGLSMGAGGNKLVHGKRLVVEFFFLGKKIQSEAVINRGSSQKIGDQVTVQFNKHKPQKCYLVFHEDD